MPDNYCDFYVYYFAPHLKYGSKIFLANGFFLAFFTRYLPIGFTPTSAFLFTSELEIIFLPNFSKFAVECDWKSKNYQKVQNLGFLGKTDGFFRKNTLKFFKILTCGKSFLECVSNGIFLKMPFHLIFDGFWQKSEKVKFGKVRKYDEETEYFEKKNTFILLKSIFSTVGGRNISRRYPGVLFILYSTICSEPNCSGILNVRR